ncbi:MAG: hypothetical protein ACI8XZ_005533 [Gammaproteobacteria bacterium]|jgi:hypothetical protein
MRTGQDAAGRDSTAAYIVLLVKVNLVLPPGSLFGKYAGDQALALYSRSRLSD